MSFDPELVEQSTKLIEDPNAWGMWPILPMKRVIDGRLETGYLYGDPVKPIKLFKGNLYTANPSTDPVEEFADAKAMTLAGWMVD